ncbi:hypothetical protein HZA43_04370 [Candidatus Peregrinibacteria bacterium]|nr:hypothetical protein [Candidatus Peregrinibacteria bacterium]
MSDLDSALAALMTIHAEAMPKANTVAWARNGKVWSGKTTDGGFWKLTKNSEEDYTTSTEKR